LHSAPIELVAFDMEGVLTRDPTVWEIMHRRLGVWEPQARSYWERYQAGEFPYDEFARMDTALWRGAPAGLLEQAARQVRWMDGCGEVLGALRRAGVRVVVISNGLLCVAERLAQEFDVGPVHANRALARGGALTGEIDILVPYDSKGALLRRVAAELGVPRERTAAVGDSASDIAMFREAALSIAFRPFHQSVADSAHHCVAGGDLRPVLSLLRVA